MVYSAALPTDQPSPWTIPLAEGPVSPRTDRIVASVVAALALAVAIRLWLVTPDARGHGTHEQLGMEPCGWPLAYGYPCPTCGCTTAATQVVHGDLLGAFATQPFGAMVALVGLFAGAHAVYCLVRRRSFTDVLVRLPFWKVLAGLTVLFFAAWGYKALVWEG